MNDTVPPELAAVLRRWNPAALAGLERPPSPEPDPGGAVTVVVLGAPGSGRGDLIAALAADTAGSRELRFTEAPDPAAGVALMVLDAAAPLGREDLELLSGGAESAHTVLFALTKIDAHHGWAAVARRNAELLTEHLPRFAGAVIHPVAAPEGAGIEELRAALLEATTAVPERRARLRLRAAGAAEQARGLIRASAESLRATDDTTTLRAERSTLVADRDGWRGERAAVLRRLTALARVDLVHEVSDQVRAESVAARAAIDRADRAALAAYPQQLRDEVAALTARVDAAADARLADLSTQVLGAALPDENRTPTVPSTEPPAPRHRGLEDRVMIVFGASAGLGLGRMVMAPLSTLPALDLASIPVTLLLGGGAAWWLARARGHLADRAHLRQWAVETLATVRSALEQRVLGRLVDTEARCAEAVLARHRERTRESEDRLAALDRELRERAGSRAGKLAACDRDLAVLEAYASGHRSVTVEPAAPVLRPTT
ncbi:hypothetical protein [Rhodococcus maanshanensis]|uniref:Dynamin family protein n=1 Tax=Rhodococcus maanshanensis TaxID=183556 RepID=A0A1H7QR49_9NOCA|nr:hypothetical protein [Rhodococcus maanshanensis]SEL50456.1 hypothetical protein SAMN05444583_1106 [Rhodococcus maanshanensis]